MDIGSQYMSGTTGLIAGPALFWAAYTYYQDRHKPEPIQYLALAFVLGLLGGCLGIHGYAGLEALGLRFDAFELAKDDRLGLFLYSIFGIGLVEELAKFLPFWIVLTRLKAFDEPVDGIIYASFVALGFASYENFAYLSGSGGMEALGRAIASPVVHVMFASIWGYAASRARMRNQPILPAVIGSLAVAVLAHGIYDDVSIGVPELQAYVPPAIIGVIWIWRLDLINRLQVEGIDAESDPDSTAKTPSVTAPC
jgi:RsiW-degrading membrane proteinase PrsW (M82 family)